MKSLIKVLHAVDYAKISQHEDLSSYLSFLKFDVEPIVRDAIEEGWIIKDETYKLSLKGQLKLVQYELSDIFDANIKNVRMLHQGMTNQSYLFDYLDESYVFRRPGKGAFDLINRYGEAEVYRLIENLSISDEILYINPNKGTKVAKYLENAEPIDSTNYNDIQASLALLGKLHDAKLQTDYVFDITERISYYYQLCLHKGVHFFKGFDKHYQDIKIIIEKLNTYQRPKVLCHVDTALSNFIKQDSKIILLDWEYAGMSDPLLDIAMLVNSCDYEETTINLILTFYLQRPYTDEERHIIDIYLALSGFLWGLWSYVKESYGEYYSVYKKRQFALSKKYCQIILK